ncbi:MAG: class I SAM-dependent methyltransferase [Planctomycetota bacterium]|jgi:SAM-dependent methyltransferase
MNAYPCEQKFTVNMQYYIDMDNRYRSPNNLMAKKLNMLLALLRPNTRFVDIGCGTGEFLLRAKDKFDELVGIDNNENAINFAKEKIKNTSKIRLINSKDDKIPYPDEYFDTATCLDVLEHMRDSKECLREIRRVLRPKSQLIVTVPNWYDIINMRFFKRNSLHVQAHSPYGWINILKEMGFKKVSWRAVDFPILHSDFLAKHFAIFGMCIVIVLRKEQKEQHK